MMTDIERIERIKSRCEHSNLDLSIYSDGKEFHAKIWDIEFHSIEDVELFLKRKERYQRRYLERKP